MRMISAQTLRVCRKEKPLHTFPDHALALHPGPDDRDSDDADDDRECDRPTADPHIADHLALGLVLSDLAIALFVVLVGRAHRPLPVTSGLSGPGCGGGLQCSIHR